MKTWFIRLGLATTIFGSGGIALADDYYDMMMMMSAYTQPAYTEPAAPLGYATYADYMNSYNTYDTYYTAAPAMDPMMAPAPAFTSDWTPTILTDMTIDDYMTMIPITAPTADPIPPPPGYATYEEYMYAVAAANAAANAFAPTDPMAGGVAGGAPETIPMEAVLQSVHFNVHVTKPEDLTGATVRIRTTSTDEAHFPSQTLTCIEDCSFTVGAGAGIEVTVIPWDEDGDVFFISNHYTGRRPALVWDGEAWVPEVREDGSTVYEDSHEQLSLLYGPAASFMASPSMALPDVIPAAYPAQTIQIQLKKVVPPPGAPGAPLAPGAGFGPGMIGD